MNITINISPVDNHELLARFVFHSRYIRSNGTVKQEAFIPKNRKLSIIRHIGLNESELWEIGKDMVSIRPETLYGRADFFAREVRKNSLQIEPTASPINHANITGWPHEKEEQKAIALELAENSQFYSFRNSFI